MAGRLISLTLLIIGIVSLSGCPFMVKPEPAGNQAPVIDDFYAVPYIGLGQTWKVFVKAHDPDGDLWEARFGIEQPGVMYGTFDGDVILPREMWKSLDGFFFLHQSSGQSMGLAGLKFVLTVEMIDRGGRHSRKVELPCTIGRLNRSPDPPGFRHESLVPIPLVLKTTDDDE